MIKVNAMGVSNKRQGKRVAYQQQPFYIRDTGGNFVNKEFRDSVYIALLRAHLVLNHHNDTDLDVFVNRPRSIPIDAR